MIGRWTACCLASCLVGAAMSPSAEDRMVSQVAAAVRRNHLAQAKCLKYTVMRRQQATSDVVRISRQHNGACGGDPNVDETLFDVTVDRATGKMTTNARDPERLEETPLPP